MEFVNKICPNCNNPNYMVLLGDFSKAYKYKCMNCNRYFNDIDFEEPLQPVWKRECLNKKVDMVEVVRCKDCKKNRKSQCPIFSTGDPYLDSKPNGNWYCADGERKQ